MGAEYFNRYINACSMWMGWRLMMDPGDGGVRVGLLVAAVRGARRRSGGEGDTVRDRWR